MATNIWKDVILVQPADGATVWIRQLMIEVPVQATWSAGSATFTVAGLTPIPWYFVSRWRPL